MSSLPALSLCGSLAAERLILKRFERFPELRFHSFATDDAPVSETWEDGIDSAGLLVLLHPDAMPPQALRQYWAGLIDYSGTTPIAFVLMGRCNYPAVFERRPFFRWPAEQRALERWVVNLLPKVPLSQVAPAEATVPEELWTTLVDQAGTYWLTGPPGTGKSRIAQAFAYAARGHFQSTLWIGCGGRAATSIEAEMQRRLPASPTLLVLDDLRRPVELPGAPHSVLVTSREPFGEGEWLDLEDRFPWPEVVDTPISRAVSVCFGPDFALSLAREIAGDAQGLPGAAAELLEAGRDRYRRVGPEQPDLALLPTHFAAVLRRFRQWRAQPERCAEVEYELEAALDFGFTACWEDAIDLCRAAFGYLSEAAGRRVEAIALMQLLSAEAEGRGDRATMEIAKRELSWLVDDDGELLPVAHLGDQLSLF